MSKYSKTISRRKFLRYTASFGAVAGISSILPAYAFNNFNIEKEVLTPSGSKNTLDLTIESIPIEIDGKNQKQ